LIDIILADDEALIRDAVATLLNLEDDINVLGVAANGLEAVLLARKVKPQVAVLDYHMPEMNGIQVAAELSKDDPPIHSLIVTSQALPGKLRTAISLGARGFAPKNVSASQLARIIRDVAAGRRYVDADLAAEALMLGDSPLTPRETEILRLAEGGTSIEYISEHGYLSPSTARNHLAAASEKLGADNRHEAVYVAKARGWI
jgi:two-component system response regulator DesR